MEDSTQAENDMEILISNNSQLEIELTLAQEINKEERKALEDNPDVAVEEKTRPNRLRIKIRISTERIAKWIRKALLARNDTNIEVEELKKENSHLRAKIALTSPLGEETDMSLVRLAKNPVQGIKLEEIPTRILFPEKRWSTFRGEIDINQREILIGCYKLMGLMRLT